MVGFIRWKNNSWFGLTSHFEIEAFAARKTRAEINVSVCVRGLLSEMTRSAALAAD